MASDKSREDEYRKVKSLTEGGSCQTFSLLLVDATKH